jgi:hypothetical protein
MMPGSASDPPPEGRFVLAATSSEKGPSHEELGSLASALPLEPLRLQPFTSRAHRITLQLAVFR